MLERAAIVTGSSRGIGRGIALALAERGWQIVINYRNNEQAAQETLEHVRALGGSGVLAAGDVADTAMCKRLVRYCLEEYGRIDLLVNNAGMAPRQRVDMLHVSAASYDEVMGVNLRGPFFLTQQVANEMIRLIQEGHATSPKIVNVGSISGYATSTDRAEYCLSKAGVRMMTMLWADRLAEYGIGVYEISAGFIETDMVAPAKSKYDRLILEEGITRIRRWGQPEDVGRAAVAIAEGYFPYSTGDVINVDGGFHLRHF